MTKPTSVPLSEKPALASRKFQGTLSNWGPRRPYPDLGNFTLSPPSQLAGRPPQGENRLRKPLELPRHQRRLFALVLSLVRRTSLKFEKRRERGVREKRFGSPPHLAGAIDRSAGREAERVFWGRSPRNNLRSFRTRRAEAGFQIS